MASRQTFGSVKPSLARVLGMNLTDARVAEYCSRAQERLLHKGKWVGTYGRFRVCVNDGCLTWPREIETVEAAAICGEPITIRNGWYEFLGNGPGVAGSCGCADGLIDREDACAFDDVRGTGKKLAVYCDGTEASGAQILLRYYRGDSNSKMYSTVDGQSVEGEYITLVAPPAYAYSTYECMAGGFYDVVKPQTLRTVRIYQYTVAGGALKPLAFYEPDETNPVYRRSIVPGLNSTCCDSESEETCARNTIDIVGKFRHRAVSKDSDSLIIQSPEALRLMVQSIRAEENNLEQQAIAREAMAIRILDAQLGHWMGSGAVAPIRMVGAESWGGAVGNLI